MTLEKLWESLFNFVVWMAKTTAAIAGIAIAIASLILLSEFQKKEGDTVLSGPAANAWILGIGLLLVIAILVVVVRALIRLLSSETAWSLFGESAVARLVGLGAATLFYPRAVYALVTAPVIVIMQMFRDLPGAVGRASNPASIPATSGPAVGGLYSVPVDQVFLQLTKLAQSIAVELGRVAKTLFDVVPIAEAVLALTLWAIVGHLLSGSREQSERGQWLLGGTNLLAYLRGTSPVQRRNFSLGAVFLLGIYLSIAAIVAIPGLKEEKLPDTLSLERLERALEPLRQPAGPAAAGGNANAENAGKSSDDGLSLLDKSLEKFSDQIDRWRPVASQTLTEQNKTLTEQNIESQRKLVESQRKLARSQLEEVRRMVDDVKGTRLQALDRLANLRRDDAEGRPQLVKGALAAYETALLSPLTIPQRASFFLDLQQSVQNQANEMQGVVRDCERAIARIDTEISRVANDFASKSSRFNFDAPLELSRRPFDVQMSVFDNARQCRVMPTAQVEYSPPEPGAGWGPFATVSQWLLKTRSQALALITGMLGFGLLGSAIETFRKGRNVSNSVAVWDEIATMIVRGLSAAIVVFLAVKGGLAIVATAEAEPNAYVLFFTCLVGAVYSDDVWTWARTKFAERFSGGDSDGGTKTGAGPPDRTGAEGQAQENTTAGPATVGNTPETKGP